MPEVTRRPRRLGSLDGLRAFAVTAVVVYHIDDRFLPGGFLGVDVFFVLSGYLVTTLMLAEHRRSGGIDVRAFWGRRVRRLWAAAWITLALVCVAGLFGVWGADRQAQLPGEVFAAVANIANYWQLGHGGYVQQFVAPSPLRHFWSLAVEEQFYLVWPLVMLGGVTLAARHGRRATWALLLGLGAVSFTIAQFVGPERAYLGTGTRAIELIAGATLAWAWSATPMRAPQNPTLRRVLPVWAGLATILLVVGAFVLHPYDEVMARGGFLAVSVATVGIVGLALVPGRTSAALSWAPLVWIGRRSYGIYLLHWPLIVMMGPGRSPWVVAAVVVPLTVLGAAVLHVLVETPLIQRRWSPVAMARGTMGISIVIVGSLLLARPTSTPVNDVAAGLAQVEDPAELAPEGGPVVTSSTTTTTICIPTSAPPPTLSPGTAGGGFDPSTVDDVVDPSAESCAGQIDVLVVGDSTGRGFSNGLAALADPGVRVWDRTTLGCSLGDEDCPNWRTEWAAATQQVQPDVAVLYFNPVSDVMGVDDPPFLTLAGAQHRDAVLREAIDKVGSTGAAVVLVTPADPRPPEGLFYCDGRKDSTVCDPEWVDAWRTSIRDVANAEGLTVLDVDSWVGDLPDDESARPDGVHFAGQALVDLAQWARPQLNEAILSREIPGG